MKDGRLNKRERYVLQKAREILDQWSEYHETSDDATDEFVIYLAENGAGAIGNFLYETRGE